MSKFAISKARSLRVAAMAWQVAQTFWVGGLWLLYFVVSPALVQMGLAPLLVQTIHDTLSPLLVGLAVCCVVLQGVVLVWVEGLHSLLKDMRGQLLLIILGMGLAFFVLHQWQPGAERWLMFNYMVLALCGLALVLQPLPGAGRTR